MSAGARHVQPTLVAVVGIALAVAWIAHAVDQREAADEQVDAMLMELAHKQGMVTNRDVLKLQLADLEQTVALTRKRLPGAFDAPELRRSLDESAAARGVLIASATFGTERVKEFYAELPLQLSVSGPASGVYAFVAELGAAPPVRHVHALRLMPADTQRTALAAEFEVTVFRFVEDTEATEPAG